MHDLHKELLFYRVVISIISRSHVRAGGRVETFRGQQNNAINQSINQSIKFITRKSKKNESDARETNGKRKAIGTVACQDFRSRCVELRCRDKLQHQSAVSSSWYENWVRKFPELRQSKAHSDFPNFSIQSVALSAVVWPEFQCQIPSPVSPIQFPAAPLDG